MNFAVFLEGASRVRQPSVPHRMFHPSSSSSQEKVFLIPSLVLCYVNVIFLPETRPPASSWLLALEKSVDGTWCVLVKQGLFSRQRGLNCNFARIQITRGNLRNKNSIKDQIADALIFFIQVMMFGVKINLVLISACASYPNIYYLKKYRYTYSILRSKYISWWTLLLAFSQEKSYLLEMSQVF